MTRDLRKYSRQTNLSLFMGFIAILLIIGGGLIYQFYGREAAILGIVCILAGLFPIVIVWVILTIVDWIVRRANDHV